MGEKDLSTKNLEAYNDVFADIFNVLIFHEDYIEESLLVDGPTETQYMTETGNLHTHHRDCMKYYQDTRLACVTFGIENQTTVDKSMPVRMMSYDCDRYIAQLKNEEAISPIVSIVLYFGDGHWDKPLSLYASVAEEEYNSSKVSNEEEHNSSAPNSSQKFCLSSSNFISSLTFNNSV